MYLFFSLSELDGDQGTGQVMLLQPHADGEHTLQAGGCGRNTLKHGKEELCRV